MLPRVVEAERKLDIDNEFKEAEIDAGHVVIIHRRQLELNIADEKCSSAVFACDGWLGWVESALEPERHVDQPDHDGHFHQWTNDRREGLT